MDQAIPGFGRKRKFDPDAGLDEETLTSTQVRRVSNNVGYYRPRRDIDDRHHKVLDDVFKLFWSPLKHVYEQLPEDYFRILIINAGLEEDPLELDLIARPIDDPEIYQALSYEWGNEPALTVVTLRDYTIPVLERFKDPRKRLQFCLIREAGPKFRIRRNLEKALKQFRHPTNNIRLWVDAICINQNNSAEKTSQIKRMADIYNRAADVWIWLGGANDKSPRAMKFVKELVEFETLQGILGKRDEETLSKWAALEEVMRSRWFSRRWVIQELAVSCRASVWCGNDRVHWDDFADAVSIFKIQHKDIARSRGLRGSNTEILANLEAFGACVLVKETGDLLRKDEEGVILERKKSMEELVSNFTAFDAGDPRDIIYAIASIARSNTGESAAGIFDADYDKSLLDVYVEFVKHAIQSSGRLDIICRHWAPARTTFIKDARRPGSWDLVDTLVVENVLPSWMKRVDESPFGIPDEIYGGRKFGDSFSSLKPIYNASGKYDARGDGSPNFSFRRRPNDILVPAIGKVPILRERYDGVMKVRGLVLGRIAQLSGRMIPGHILQEVLSMGGWEYSLLNEDHTVDVVPDKLWRTLVANRGPDGQPAPISYRRSCLYAIQRENASGDIDLNSIIRQETTPTIVVHYLDRVQDVLWNRKAFLGGYNNDLFGLCSRNANEGDYVCILYGCSVPVILRKLPCRQNLGQKLKQKQKRRGRQTRTWSKQTSLMVSHTSSKSDVMPTKTQYVGLEFHESSTKSSTASSTTYFGGIRHSSPPEMSPMPESRPHITQSPEMIHNHHRPLGNGIITGKYILCSF
jgi:hypothetical protein